MESQAQQLTKPVGATFEITLDGTVFAEWRITSDSPNVVVGGIRWGELQQLNSKGERKVGVFAPQIVTLTAASVGEATVTAQLCQLTAGAGVAPQVYETQSYIVTVTPAKALNAGYTFEPATKEYAAAYRCNACGAREDHERAIEAHLKQHERQAAEITSDESDETGTEKHAALAKIAVDAYQEASNSDDDDVVSDLLGDLMHLRGEDFHDDLARACRYYEDECASHEAHAKRDKAQDALACAIDHLGAIEVAPNQYAWKERNVADDGETWYSASAESLTQGTHRIDGVPLPAWWTPEKRFAVRCSKCEKHGSAPFGPILCECVAQTERVTVNYETGDEIPA